tara:strand:- start:2828 stop:3187 length:360 start_codon:yes stop_codon:yes gene_type:complete
MTKLKYFKESEFECCCGNCFHHMDQNLLLMLDESRNIANTPFSLNSSWRCEEHNKDVDGKKNSAHLRGCAVDIACDNSSKRLVILDALIIAGFTRIGISKSFIHADIDMTLPQEVLWLY